MALNAYLKLKGQVSGDIKGSVTIRGREGRIAVIAATHQIVSPRDPATGQATGKRAHKPFVITKEVDQSTPQLYAAMASNELMSEFELQFFAPRLAGAGQGVEVQHYTVRLTKAAISSIEFVMPNNKEPDMAARAEYEEVAFTYQKIDWIWVATGGTATDNW